MIYFSPRQFPHLAGLPQERYEQIISRSLPKFLPLYTFVYATLVMLAMILLRHYLYSHGLSFVPTAILSSIAGLTLGYTLYLGFINLEFYKNTLECKKYMDANAPQ